MLKDYNDGSNSNKVMHFLPGNSFTPCTYSKMLDGFSNKFLIKISLLRALWSPEPLPKFKNWDIFLDDYLSAIENESNIIGVGHSIGGNLLLKSAILNPEKFNKIILLDPTFFRPIKIWGWKIVSFFNMQSYFNPYIKYAENKKMQYSSIEEMFFSYRKHQVFSKFSDKDLRLLVESLTVDKDNSINLIFDSKWDAAIYRTALMNDMFIWDNLKNLSVDTLIIRADNSDVFFKETEKLVLRKNNKITIKTIDKADHLFPINMSSETIDLIQKFV